MSQNEVVVPTFTFEVPTGTENIFYSFGDENSFFQWIYRLSGYKSSVGSGESLRIDFKITKMDRETLVDLIAIFRRYNLGLPSLCSPANAQMERGSLQPTNTGTNLSLANDQLGKHRDVLPRRVMRNSCLTRNRNIQSGRR